MSTTLFQNTFEGQTSGAKATLANSGNSGDAFSAFPGAGASGVFSYEEGAAASGSMGLRMAVTATNNYPRWDTDGSDGRRVILRRSFYWSGTDPAAVTTLLDARTTTTASAVLGFFSLRGTLGQVQVWNNSVTLNDSRFVLPSAGRYKVELAAVSSTPGNNDGVLEYRLYAANGTTLIHSWSSGPIALSSSTPNQARLTGVLASSGWTHDDIDDVQAMFTDDLDAWIGEIGTSRVLAPPTGVTVEEITAPTGLDTDDGTIRVSWDGTTDPDAGSYEIGIVEGENATGFTPVGTMHVRETPLEFTVEGLSAADYTVAVRTRPATGSYGKALANIATEKCRILWVGDSLPEGQGASTWDLRPPVAVLDRLRTRYSVTEDGGVPVHRFYNGASGSESWGLLGTVSDPAEVIRDNDYSLSKRGMAITAGSYWLAPTPAYDFRYVEVWYTEHTGLGMAGGVNLVDTDGPVTLLTIDTTAGDTGPKRAIYDYGSLGSREVGLNPQMGLAYVDSIAFHQTHPDTGAGFAVIDSTTAGISSNAMGSGSTPWMGWPQAGADLVIDDLWHNDALGAVDVPAVAAGRFADRVGRYRSIREDITIVLLMMWDVPGIGANDDLGLGYSFNAYRAAMSTAATTAGVAVLNLADLEPTPNAGWFGIDGIHHNDTGYAEVADRIDTFLHGLVT